VTPVTPSASHSAHVNAAKPSAPPAPAPSHHAFINLYKYINFY